MCVKKKDVYIQNLTCKKASEASEASEALDVRELSASF